MTVTTVELRSITTYEIASPISLYTRVVQ